ncbi:alpha/beta hydrolase family protein [Undibacterium danionis]|uniref:Alpha/beta hydrolase family protein n=1 Tax=Undibacterium danionis TaxID=1812100 RepID=A0ABV6IHQ6_9BURK
MQILSRIDCGDLLLSVMNLGKIAHTHYRSLLTCVFISLFAIPPSFAQQIEAISAPNQVESALRNEQALPIDSQLYRVEMLDWLDPGRQRAVPAKLYLPTLSLTSQKLPLVIFSHGLGGSREGYSYLGKYLASHGYASLHLQHVGSDRSLWTGSRFTLLFRLAGAANDAEAIARARDVSFALDQILGSDLGVQFDTDQIFVAGHSFGANTAMLVAGASVMNGEQEIHLQDKRIKAAILISAPPFYGKGNVKKILADIAIPSLHITSTQDDINIPGYGSGVEDRIKVFNAMSVQTQAEKNLLVFKDGSHSIFTDRMNTGGEELNPKVKLATRSAIRVFLDHLRAKSELNLKNWQQDYAALLAQFEINTK